MKKQITRKEFLSNTTKTVVAVSAAAAGVSALAVANGQTGPAGVVSSAAVPAWPWPYKKLDPEDVRKRAHKAYFDGGCCYGAFNAIVSALAETVGEPYTLVPSQMMYFGGGGGAGWGTLCGALNGAAAALSLFIDRTNANNIIGELFGWYTEAPFPSDTSNTYATAHQFLVNRNDQALKQTVANSPLCHASVSVWCTLSGTKATDAARGERCARLTGDTAAKAVQMANDFFAGQFKTAFTTPQDVTTCLACHGNANGVGNVQSGVKQACPRCHRSWDHLY